MIAELNKGEMKAFITGLKKDWNDLDKVGKPPRVTADEILSQVNIHVRSETLSDGSMVWNLMIGDRQVGCLSLKHATHAAMDIAIALRNASTQFE